MDGFEPGASGGDREGGGGEKMDGASRLGKYFCDPNKFRAAAECGLNRYCGKNPGSRGDCPVLFATAAAAAAALQGRAKFGRPMRLVGVDIGPENNGDGCRVVFSLPGGRKLGDSRPIAFSRLRHLARLF